MLTWKSHGENTLSEQMIFQWLILAWLVLAVLLFITLVFIRAPYGRYSRAGWGPTISDKAGWLIMETSSVMVFAACFATGSNPKTIALLLLFVLWEANYIHRAFIYPFSRRDSNKQMPLLVIGSGVFFNVVNAYLNGRYIFALSNGYGNEWLKDPRLVIGLLLFITGFVVNRWADRVLYGLRKSGETVYGIPHGGLYRWISCPNYFGEIIMWIGWAIATWSLPGLAFAVWTAANLVPRARSHQQWYHQQFNNYPPERKALVPRIW